MTTKVTGSRTATVVPEVLTEEHHEALKRSWELPAYEREQAPRTGARRPLVAGLVAGAIGLAIGFGAGYLVRGESPVAEPIVLTSVNGPVDANGLNLGRRVAPFDTTLPIGITLGGPVDANGQNLGRRVAPFETQPAADLAQSVPVDANGLNLGRRVAPLKTGLSVPEYAYVDDLGHALRVPGRP